MSDDQVLRIGLDFLTLAFQILLIDSYVVEAECALGQFVGDWLHYLDLVELFLFFEPAVPQAARRHRSGSEMHVA